MLKTLLIILGIGLSACASGSLSQDGGDLTRSEVEFLGKKMSEAIEAKYPLLKHKLVNSYVDSLGQTIVSRNPDMPPLPYEFRVLKTNEVNLFSLPGGIVYITLGALRAVPFEAVLAGAIAHELAHQQLGHGLKIWRKKVNARRGQKYILVLDGDFEQSFFAADGALRYSEGMEKEADAMAPVILYRAMFDPRAYTSYLGLLKKIESQGSADVASLMEMHPPIDQRIAWAKEAQNQLPPLKEPRISTQSFEELKIILKNAVEKGKKEK